MTPDPNPLAIEALAHTYGATPVLAPVSLEVGPGELLAILGPSGCGKTTLLRAIAGLVQPTQGAIRIGGVEVSARGRQLVPAEERRVGLVFQNYALFGHLSVAENVGFGLRPRDPARVAELLERVGLGEFAERDPRSLSGGQQQRVALARAIAPRPHVLLLDEPFANVDAELRLRLGLELREVLAREGTPAILVTHDRDDALRSADRVAAFVPGPQGGRLAQIGTPETLYRRPSEAAVASLTGRASWVSGEAAGRSVETALGTLELAEERQGPVEVLLRPEQVRARASESGGFALRGSGFAGSAFLVRLTCAGRELWGEAPTPITSERAHVEVRGPCWALPASREDAEAAG